MTTSRTVFSKIEEPTVLDDAQWQERLATTRQHVRQAMEEKGGTKLWTDYQAVVQLIEQLHQRDFVERIRILVQAKVASLLLKGIAGLQERMRGFVSIRELEADVGFLIAESAEIILRSPGTKPGLVVTLEEIASEVVQGDFRKMVGIDSIEEVVSLFQGSSNIYLEVVIDLIRQGGDSPLGLLLDQLVIKHLVAVQRPILLEMAMRIEALGQGQDQRIHVATRAAVLPYLRLYPQVREVIDEYDLSPTFLLASYTMANPFITKEAVVSFYTNLANLAILLGQYELARNCYKIVQRFVTGALPDEVQSGIQLLKELDPQPNAEEE